MSVTTRDLRLQEESPAVKFLLNGKELSAAPGETLIEVADREGIDIPRLCYKPGMEAVGNCRSCMVEIKGERVLAASCCRSPTAGMQVTTNSERVLKAQQLVIELLQSVPSYSANSTGAPATPAREHSGDMLLTRK